MRLFFLGNRPPFFFLVAFSFAPVLSPLHFLSLEKEERKAEKTNSPPPPLLFPYIYFFCRHRQGKQILLPSSDLYLGSKRRYFSVWGSEGGECVLCGHKGKKCFQERRRQVQKQKKPNRFMAKAKHCLRCVKVYLGTKTRNRKYVIQRPGYFAKTRMIFLGSCIECVRMWERVVSESHPISLSDHLIMPLTEGHMA